MDIKLQIALFALTGLSILVYGAWLVKTEKRLSRFFIGKKGKDLEDTIEALTLEISKLKNSQSDSEHEIQLLQNKLRKSIRGLETIRFNPFPDQGGNQSFAIGMVDEEGSGVVISSLYSRERMSIFAKPVKNGKSEYDLTTEEREALNKAKV
jgi:hypothetical protein